LIPEPASAEVGAVVSAYSDYRFRGLTLSDGRPVGIIDLSYDASDGLYAALSASVVAARHEGLRPLGLALNGGYAVRVRSGLTADFGIVHARYSRYSGVANTRSYTEFYGGISGRYIGARLSVSPSYVGTSSWTLRGEANGHIDITRKLTLDGAIGALVPIGRSYNGSGVEWDGRVGLARRIGPVSLHAALSGTAGGRYVYTARRRSRTALIFGISTAL
jgi:uncharacterized protein (TIGR02001 family)